MHTSQSTRRYRVSLLPSTVSREDAELKADQGVLPYLQFHAANSGVAMLIAYELSGMPAIRADRADRFEPAIGLAAAHQRGRELHHLTERAEQIAAARMSGAGA